MSNRPFGKLNRALSFLLLIAILGAIGGGVYLVREGTGETFTEFYVLNVRGKASDYPSEVVAGEPAEVMLGIVNREQETITYNVEIRIDGVKTGTLGPVSLEHGSRSEQIVSFTAEKPGAHQKVEFQLYKQGQTGVYETLYLWVDVIR